MDRTRLPSSFEDQLLLKQRLKSTIASMDGPTLHRRCLPLLRCDRDRFCQAVLQIVEDLNTDELRHWSEEFSMSLRSLRTERQAAETTPKLAVAAVSDFGEPPEAISEFEVAASVDVVEDYVEEVVLHQLIPLVAPSAQLAARRSGGETISDFPIPEAYSDDPTNVPVWDVFLGSQPDADTDDQSQNYVSAGQWLAVQQELRTKDFAIEQLQRQLGFEQSRDEWLMSEVHWREKRERHITSLAWRDACSAEVFNEVDQAVNTFMGEDRLVEDMYCLHGQDWWTSEAEAIHGLFSDITSRGLQDHTELTDIDRMEYNAYLKPMLEKFLKSFNTRRSDAEELQSSIVQEMKKHHTKVRNRLLATAMPFEDSTSLSSNETLNDTISEDLVYRGQGMSLLHSNAEGENASLPDQRPDVGSTGEWSSTLPTHAPSTCSCEPWDSE